MASVGAGVGDGRSRSGLPIRWVTTMATMVALNLAVALRGLSDRWTHGLGPMAHDARVVAMSMVYALYYRMHRRDPPWKYGILFAFFYTGVLVWQLPVAIANLSDTRWGTRAC